jgi:tRNA(Ile)-lysidine synthase
MKILEQFLKAIRSFQMLNKGDCVIVAVSGGPDSVALLQLLRSIQQDYRLELIVAHLNHRLRGDASDADEQFVRQLSQDCALKCLVDQISPGILQRLRRENLEAGIRQQRYEFLRRCAAIQSAQKIAVGHTMNDQAETVLMRLIRGGGSLGLSAISPARADGVIRPLLFIRREEILNFLREDNREWREDSSNHDRRFFRNKLRHELIPFLLRYNPKIVEQLSRTAEILREDQSSLDDWAGETISRLVLCQGQRSLLEVEKMKQLPKGLQRSVLRRIMLGRQQGARSSKMPDFQDYSSLSSLLEEGKSGKILHRKGMRICREFGNLIFEPQNNHRLISDFILSLPIPGEIELSFIPSTFRASLPPVVPSRNVLNRWELYLTEEELRSGLQIRNWKAGDRYFPHGASSPKKLKELFARKKISRGLRSSWPIITLMEKIVFAKDFAVSMEMLERSKSRLYQPVIVEELGTEIYGR